MRSTPLPRGIKQIKSLAALLVYIRENQGAERCTERHRTALEMMRAISQKDVELLEGPLLVSKTVKTMHFSASRFSF